MSNSNRLAVTLFATAILFAFSADPSAFSQRIRGGNANQGNSEEKKEKDDNDQQGKKTRRGQGGQQGQGANSGSNQSNQSQNQNSSSNKQGSSRENRSNNNQGQNPNSNSNANQNPNNPRGENRGIGKEKEGGASNTDKSGNSKVPTQFQPFIPGGRNQDDKDRNDRDRKDRDFRDRDNDGQNLPGQGGRFINPGGNINPGDKLNPGITIGPGGVNNPPSGSRKVGRWQGDRWEGSRKADHWMEHFGGKQRLFSSQWYKDHPQAWKYNNDRANVWVVATVPGIYSWLGWGSVPQQYAVGYGPSERFDASQFGDWYPLGVYSLMSGGDDMGTRVVQLAVNRHGRIEGNYFDMITNDDKSLAGNIDRQSQRVEFWLNRNPYVRFRASVFQLLQQPYGSLTVRLPGGDQRWQFVRLEN